MPVSGAAFTAVTNGKFCVNPLTFSILDAAGLQTTAELITTVGTNAPPSTLVVSPLAWATVDNVYRRHVHGCHFGRDTRDTT